jgi:hypothetical protein
MALQLFKIASTTVESPVSSIEFTSIPSGYTDLLIKYSLRVSAGVERNVGVKFNSSTTNFSARVIDGSGTAVSSSTYSSLPRYVGAVGGTGITSNTFTNGEIYIPNYTSSNYKSYSVDNVQENNATGAYASLIAGLWSNTSAITSISFDPDAYLFDANSTATLYGIL